MDRHAAGAHNRLRTEAMFASFDTLLGASGHRLARGGAYNFASVLPAAGPVSPDALR